jgi:cytochrome c peroxidase
MKIPSHKIILITSLMLFSSFVYAKELFYPLIESKNHDQNIVNLGRELFFETSLSKDNDISCVTCHNNYGADTLQFSIGHKKQKGNINTPSVFNLSNNIAFFWNGRSETLEEQMIIGPLFNEVEMASSKELIEKRLKESEKYQKLFKKAYQKEPNFNDAVHAIVEFEKTLISINSKFDKYLRGEIFLSKDEEKGLELFTSYGCVSCHNGVNIGGNSYQKFGSVIEYKEAINLVWLDRFSFTNDIEDKNIYKVPSLRNVEKTAPYFHSGSIDSLTEAIYTMAYFNVGIILERNEIEFIESFLKTLTGEIPKSFGNTDD